MKGRIRSPTNGQEIRATGRDGKALLAKSEEEDVITVTKVCDSLYMAGKAKKREATATATCHGITSAGG